jgi:putative transcriptional regulator
MMESLAGQFLVASTELNNDFFAQTLVLVLQHSEQGAAGIALNKQSESPISDIWPQLIDLHPDFSKELVRVGGPCEGPIVAIHDCVEFTEVPLLPGVAMSVQPENLERLVARGIGQIRVFSGYSGWGPGQLEKEVERGGWYSIRATADLVYEEPAEQWRRACDLFGTEIIAPIAGNVFPTDPSLN